jgi:pimeloyl-ACP methyl ester carboxylesterase
MATTLFTETVGAGSPALLLLHGVGVNGAVWQPLMRELADWPGRIVAPDLRGHGRSPPARHYSMGHHAADVADLFAPGEVVHAVGHSMGGAVALVLASGWFGLNVARVTAFGTKATWSEEELARAAKLADTPARWFDSRAAAADRFLRVAGLFGEIGADAPVVEAGIVQEGGRYRLAADMATVRAAGPLLRDMAAAARAPFRLMCGARDPIVSIAELRACDPDAIEVDGSGHNPHVDAPARLAALIRTLHLGGV